MSNPKPIVDSNVSVAWVKAVKQTLDTPNSPLCVSITNLQDGIEEDIGIRENLDELLKSNNIISARETSETIFPFHWWSKKFPPASELTEWYKNIYLPRHRVRVRMSGGNIPRETYFERLVAYNGFKTNKNGKLKPTKIDQIKRIVDTFKHYNSIGKQPSPSKFIATCYNPSTDNTNNSPYFMFPCLQQIGFSFAKSQLTVTGYYTIQYMMKRGYGNYLGLCYLGQFISNETGVPLSRVNCFVGNPRVDAFNQQQLRKILSFA